MSDCSLETRVSPRDFKVGIADAGKQHTHQRLRTSFRPGYFVYQQFLFVYLKSEHKNRGQKSEVRSQKSEVRGVRSSQFNLQVVLFGGPTQAKA
jgi:hypothetical protein